MDFYTTTFDMTLTDTITHYVNHDDGTEEEVEEEVEIFVTVTATADPNAGVGFDGGGWDVDSVDEVASESGIPSTDDWSTDDIKAILDDQDVWEKFYESV